MMRDEKEDRSVWQMVNLTFSCNAYFFVFVAAARSFQLLHPFTPFDMAKGVCDRRISHTGRVSPFLYPKSGIFFVLKRFVYPQMLLRRKENAIPALG